MANKYFKEVLLPIRVAAGDLCWGEGKICGKFNNEGGHPSCDLGFDLPLKPDKEGHVPKPTECKELKEVIW